MMDKLVGKVALVTGASAGIGAAIAKRLVEHGMKVVGCSRNIQNIESMAESLKDSKGSLTAIQCDVSKEDQILSMFEKIRNQFGGVDVCINNAGLVHNAPLLTGSTEQWKSMYDINVIGLMICSREAVKSMQERGVDDGNVIILSSIAGHKVKNSPPTHVYASTKFAVRAITEGLRNELHALKSHIRVTAISPGVVETEIVYRMYPDNPKVGKQAYSRFTCIQPEEIADAVVYSLSAPTRTQWKGLDEDPSDYGWELSNGVLVPKLIDMAPAPAHIIKVIKCSCRSFVWLQETGPEVYYSLLKLRRSLL